MSEFAIAGLQLALAAEDNQERIARHIALTMQRFPWVQMIVLSELATFGPLRARAQPLPGPAEEAYRQLARRHGIWLVPGSLYERCEDRTYNTASAIAPDGTVVARYRKIYPFLPYEAGIAHGSEISTFDVPGVGRFGLSICYDQWFPEVSRALAWRGAEVILHPTMTGTTDRGQELILARANAIANQCYFIDINSAGELGNGRSILVGPEGDVLHQAGDAAETIPMVLDLARVRRTRAHGLQGLGQMLKSFRDTAVRFPCYNQAEECPPALHALGPLALRTRDHPVA